MAGYPLLAFSLAAIVAGAMSPGTWPGRWTVPGARRLAAMAFSLYLTHKQAYHWIEAHFGAQLEECGLLAFCACNGAALAAGAFLYLAVERPGLRMRGLFDGRASRKRDPQPA